MRNFKSLLILSIVITSVFLVFPHKSFAGFSCSSSGSTATFSLTGCPNPTPSLALRFQSWPSATVSSSYAQCYYPASVSLPSPGSYTFNAYDSNNTFRGGCSVSASGGSSSGGGSITPPPASGSGTPAPAPAPAPTGTISVSISGIPSASYTITGPTTITGANSATYSSKPTGTYTIVWGTIAGYTSPSPQSLVLSDGGTITFSGTFVQTGTVVVLVSGARMASWVFKYGTLCPPLVPSPCFGDVGFGYGSSATYALPSGSSYVIVWNTVIGYVTPASQTFTVPSGGGKITITGTYIGSSDLTTGLITPVTATTGTATTFTSSINNIGSSDSVATHIVIGTYPVSYSQPGSITYDIKQNAVWMIDSGKITKRNASDGTLVGTYGDSTYYAITYDVTQNAVWATRLNSSGMLTRIDASTGNIVGNYLPDSTNQFSGAYITYDVTQNAVWVANACCNLHTLTKLNASTGGIIGTYPSNSTPSYTQGPIAYDSTQNAVWTLTYNPTTLTKLNASTGGIISSYSIISFFPVALTYDVTQNAVWSYNYDFTVSKTDASNGNLIGTYNTNTITPASYYYSAIAYDVTQNAVWVTSRLGSTNVVKLNALTGSFIATYNTVGDVITYDSKQNAIWVGSSSQGNVTKLDASTGPGFHNFFQVATAADGGGTITDLASSTMSVLTAGASTVATSSPYTFTTAGNYSVRACADNTSSAGGGVVPESNENNNCGAWTNITVTSPSGIPTGSITTNDCTIVSGSTCPATISWTTSSATSTSIQQNGIEFSTSASGSISRNISYGLNTFILFNGSTILDTKYAVGSVSDQGKTGTANGTTRDTAPSTPAELCTSGTVSAVTTTANGWSWTCGSGIGIVNGMATKTSTAVCGNNTCESSETLLSCPKDCKGKIQQF